MSAIPPTRIKHLALAGAAACSLAACTTVPGANVAAGAPITPAEAQLGAQYHPQFLEEFGGAMTGPQAPMSSRSAGTSRSSPAWQFAQSAFNVTLLNSSVDNAFAVPGGYVYVTRQLVT
jgi:predicted Zn-dependent protease